MEKQMNNMKSKMSKDTHIVVKIVEWLDANVEEESIPYEVRLDSAKLRDRIETWRNDDV